MQSSTKYLVDILEKWCYELLGARIRKNAFFRRVEVLFPKGLYIGENSTVG